MSTWHIMHDNTLVATLESGGTAHIADMKFMPFDLWLEEGKDLDTLVNNITNFNFWCAARVLTLDRQYAKIILGSIGAMQGRTDKERAQIALSYHCLSLTDVFWVKDSDEDISYDEINLYDNHLDNALVDLSLRGRSMTVENAHFIADDLSTSGVFPKAWVRKEDGFYLYKDGSREAVENELLASRIAGCFDCHQVEYKPDIYDGTKVTSSKLMTSRQFSIATRAAFEIYAVNRDLDPLAELIRIDSYSYHMMNIIDYVTGNTDRHWENWGVLIDNESGSALRLHDLMDFNQTFNAYDDLNGAMCQTTLPQHISQKDAAIWAVKEIGLNMVSDIDPTWFGDRSDLAEMCVKRIELLKNSMD